MRRTQSTACARLLAACAATALGPTLALAAGPEVIFTEIASHPSSSVPGARGFDGLPAAARFATITDLTPSPDRTKWMLRATTDQHADLGQVLILGEGLVGDTLMQESLPVPGAPPTSTVDFVGFDTFPSGGFASNGDFAFAVRVDNDGSIAETIMRSIGGTLAPYLDQFSPLFGLQDPNGIGNETIGNTVDSVHLLDDGRVAYRAGNVANVHSSYRPAVMFNDNQVFLQAGVSMFTDMFSNSVALSDIRAGQFCMTQDASNWLVSGVLDYGIGSPVDAVLIVNGDVVIQEGQFIPGTTILVADGITFPIARAIMLADGTWFARGVIHSNFGGGQWVVRNGTPIAVTGQEITPGSGEHWGGTILAVNGTVGGNYVVAGETDNANTDLDRVVVLNGEQVVLREGDPVDLDGNGLFDDDVFISNFAADDMYLTEDFQLYFLAILRNGAGTTIGDAFLRQQILTPAPGDLAVQITDSPDPLGVIGGEIAYSVTVRNFSPDPATNVVVTTNLDPTTAFVSSTVGSHAAGVHTANLGTVDPLSAQTYQIVVQANTAGSPAATATVNGTETDPNPANNTAMTSTTVEALADLTVAVIDSPDPMHLVNGQITYDVMVTNNGPSTANNVVLTADLAPESTFFSTTAGSHAGGVVTADLGSIGVGASANVTIVVDTSVNASYVTSINATSSTTDPATSDNTAVATTNVLIDADLEVAASVSPPALGGTGQQTTYTLEITNDGPTDATDVNWSFSLPAEVMYVSSSAGMHSAGVVSGVVSSIAVDATEVITVTVESTGFGNDLLATFSASPTVPGDSNGANNSAAAALTIFDPVNAPPAVALLTNDEINDHLGTTLSTSLAPGLGGLVFAGFDRPFISANGRNWIMRGTLDTSSTFDNIVIFSQDSVVQIAAQEGVTAFPDGSGSFVGSTIDALVSINDSGEYAFHSTASNSSSVDAILKGSGSNIPGGTGTLHLIAKDLNPVPNPSIPGAYAAIESPVILNDGTVWMVADTDLTPTSQDEYVLSTSDNGATVDIQIQEGVTPIQDGLWGEFDQNQLWVTGDGAHVLLDGVIDLVPTQTAIDSILVYDNTVVLQENVTVLPGFFSELDGGTPVDEISLAHNGDWFARGSNNDDTHWVVRNGEVLARSGDPLFPGSTEVWRHSSTTNSFNLVAGDTNGNFVIGGFVESPDDNTRDQVLVLNNERIILRELDPVDIDGDGLFNEDTFIKDIGSFSTGTLTDKAVITADGKLVVVVTLRAFGSVSTIGDAVLELDLGLTPACVCETDGNTAQVDVFDLLAYLDDWFANAAAADIDGTPGVDVFDLLAFLDCWFPASAGNPC